MSGWPCEPTPTEWPEGWIPLGSTTDGFSDSIDVDRTGQAYRTITESWAGRTMVIRTRLGYVSPAGYRLAFRRTHPKITRMHAAYHRRRRYW